MTELFVNISPIVESPISIILCFHVFLFSEFYGGEIWWGWSKWFTGVNASSYDIVGIVKIAVSLFDLHLHCKQWEKGPENKGVHFF